MTPTFADPPFAANVFALFAMADIREELGWTIAADDIQLWANVSDVFAWGGTDAEDITSERFPILEQAYADLQAIGAAECLAELYAARIRGMRPQGAAYPTKASAQALFNACGPERPVGPGNPKQPPQPKADPS